MTALLLMLTVAFAEPPAADAPAQVEVQAGQVEVALPTVQVTATADEGATLRLAARDRVPVPALHAVVPSVQVPARSDEVELPLVGVSPATRR
jgi:hypothetical protein